MDNPEKNEIIRQSQAILQKVKPYLAIDEGDVDISNYEPEIKR